MECHIFSAVVFISLCSWTLMIPLNDTSLASRQVCQYTLTNDRDSFNCPVLRSKRRAQYELYIEELMYERGMHTKLADAISKAINVEKHFGTVDQKLGNIEMLENKVKNLEHLMTERLGVVKNAPVEAQVIMVMGPASKGARSNVVPSGVMRSCDGSPKVLYYRDCSHAYVSGHHKSAMYYIKVDYSACPIPVYCDMETTKGGWTVILRRQDGTVSFQKNWEEYQNGFGNLTGEFWFGNDNIFLMTHQDNYILRIDMWDFEGEHKYAEYSKFWIDGRNEDYKLHLGEYSGNAGNSLNFHNGSKFSTRDNDNDSKPKSSCAITLKGGWWFNECYMGFLTGRYKDSPISDENAGMIWLEWKVESLKRAEMKIRHRH